MLDSPLSILYDDAGNPLAVSSSQAVGLTQPGLVFVASGTNGTWQPLRLASPTNDLFVTGTVALQGGTVGISGTPTVVQGNAGSNAQGWFIKISDGTQVLGTGSSAPVWITGSVQTGPATVNFPATQSIDVGRWSNGVTASMREIGGSTSTVSATLAWTGSNQLLAQNSNRIGAIFFKEGSNTAFLKFGTLASTSSYSLKISNNGYYELPYKFTGIVHVAFSDNTSGSNKILTTEIILP